MSPVLALNGPEVVWSSLTPLLVLLGGAMMLLVVGSLTPTWPRRWYSSFTVLVALGTLGASVALWHRVDVDGESLLVGEAMHLDRIGVWVTITISVAVLLLALLSDDYLRREGLDGPDTGEQREQLQAKFFGRLRRQPQHRPAR